MSSRSIRLFRSGGEQAFQIPSGFELPGTEVLITKVGERLIIEPATSGGEIVALELLESIDDDDPK